MISYVRVGDFFNERNDLEKKCVLSQLNVFSIKGLGGMLVLSLNYWRSCTGSLIYYWPVQYLSRILRPSHLSSVSPRASHFKTLNR